MNTITSLSQPNNIEISTQEQDKKRSHLSKKIVAKRENRSFFVFIF